jgi:hypothetical protein
MPLHSTLTGADLHEPGAHKTQHEDGGTDEISLTGLTGAPLLTTATTAVTQSPGDNSTKVATTAYVDAAAASASLADGDYGDITVGGSGTTLTIDSGAVSGSKIASSVALAGSPTTTTQSAADNSTKIATTAYVDAAAALKASLSGATFSGDINVPDEAYDATTWNGSTEAPTKNAIRDKIESLTTSVGLRTVGAGFSGGGVAMTLDGDTKVVVGPIDFGGTIDRVTVVAVGGPGSCTFGVKSCARASYPGSLADITGGADVDLSSSHESEDATLSGWTTSVSDDDVFEFELKGTSTITSATVLLHITPT